MYSTLFRRGLQYNFYLRDRNVPEGQRNTISPLTGVGKKYCGLAGVLPQEAESKYTDHM